MFYFFLIGTLNINFWDTMYIILESPRTRSKLVFSTSIPRYRPDKCKYKFICMYSIIYYVFIKQATNIVTLSLNQDYAMDTSPGKKYDNILL